MDDRLLPYPWSAGEGLAAVLREPALWAAAFPDRDLRNTVVRAAKRRFQRRAIERSDDKAIGSIVVDLLASRRGRIALFKQVGDVFLPKMRGSQHVASRAWSDGLPKLGVEHLPIELCEQRDSGHYFLLPDRFALWLGSQPNGESEMRRVALGAALFAILQPDIGGGLAKVMLERDLGYSNLLHDPTEVIRPPSRPPLSSDTVDPEHRTAQAQTSVGSRTGVPGAIGVPTTKTVRAVPSVTPPSSGSSPAAPSSESRPAKSEAVPFSAGGFTVRAAEVLHRELNLRLKEIHRNAVSLAEHAKTIESLPWFSPPPQMPIPDFAEISVDAALTVVNEALTVSTRLIRAHEELSSVGRRLGRADRPLIEGVAPPIEDALRLLEEAAAKASTSLAERENAERSSSAFLQALLRLPPAAAESALGEASETELASLFLGASRVPMGNDELLASLHRDAESTALLLALLWDRAPQRAVEALGALVASSPRHRSELLPLLSYLSFGQIQELGSTDGRLALYAAEALLAAALSTGRAELYDYLGPLVEAGTLRGPCASFFSVLVVARQRNVAFDLSTAQGPDESVVARRNTDRAAAHQAVLDLARLDPGMSKNYYRLRVFVRDHYMKPVAEHVRSGRLDEALGLWRSLPPPPEMVEHGRRSLPKLHNTLDPSHRHQTVKFIEEFARELDRLVVLSHPAQRPPFQRELEQALAGLRRDSERNQDSRELLAVLQDPPRLPRGFGERCEYDPDFGPVVRTESPDPTYVLTYPRLLAAGRAPLGALAVDRLRGLAGLEPRSATAAVQHYLALDDFDTAARAAQGTELAAFVEEQAAARFSAVRAEAATLLQSAASVSEDELVAICLGDLTEAEERRDVESFRRALRELASAVERAQRDRQPRRRELIAFLKEAGLDPPANAELDWLEREADRVRSNAEERRLHIDVLRSGLVSAADLPEEERERWASLAERVDYPGRWPSGERALEIAAALEIIATDVREKWKYREDEPSWAELALLEVRAACGLVEAELLVNGGAGRRVDPLADAIHDGAPEPHIRKLLGEAPPPRRVRRTTPTPESRAETSQEVRLLRRDAGTVLLRDIIDEIRTFLDEHARLEEKPAPNEAGEPELRRLFAVDRWVLARRAAAELVLRQADQRNAEKLLPVEAAYAVALALALDPSDARMADFSRVACLAEAFATGSKFFSGKHHWLIPRALVALTSGSLPPPDDLSAKIPTAIEVIARDPAHPASAWFQRLMRDAALIGVPETDVPASARFALELWEQVEGKKSYEPRSELLLLLHRGRREEALRYLARGMVDVENMILACLVALERAATDPVVRSRLPQLFDALRHVGKTKANIQAWLTFFAMAYPLGGEFGQTLSVKLRSTDVEVESDGSVLLPVSLEPPALDYPASLQIEFPDATTGVVHTLSLDDDVLLTPKDAVVRVSRDWFGPGEMVEVPHRITGRTINGASIDLRSTWTLRPTLATRVEPLTDDEIQDAWPGHTGDPVTSLGGFHGRDRERTEIQRYLGRQRSILLLGRRRVGKTSLLFELVSLMPPRPDGLTAAFVDVAGLQAAPEELPRALFQHILAALQTKPQNKPIRDALEHHSGGSVDFAQIAGRIDASRSIDHPLEALVQVLAHESGGQVSRLAIFIDEFDRFVGYLLAGDDSRRAVEALLWQLRSLSQGSKSVALLLAGSGLARMLTDSYTSALFGSIVQTEVREFDLERDRRAIEDTFLPPSIRGSVCREEAFSELVVRAHELSGGHPYYLAVLGHAAASLARGRLLTPSVLDRVASEIVTKNPRATGIKASAKTFYGHIFDTLGALPAPSRYAAHVILAHVAQRTTTEFPRFPVAEAIEPVELRSMSLTDRQGAFKSLVDEGVFVQDGRGASASVLIAVPLTAAAVREEASRIIHDALIELKKHEESKGA